LPSLFILIITARKYNYLFNYTIFFIRCNKKFSQKFLNPYFSKGGGWATKEQIALAIFLLFGFAIPIILSGACVGKGKIMALAIFLRRVLNVV